MRRKKVNYLNNKDMLSEIHKSKISYCHYQDEKYTMYDGIVYKLEEITPEFVTLCKEARVNRVANKEFKEYISENEEGSLKLKDFKIDPSQIPTKDLVIRIITWDHIPLDLKRKKTHKTVSDKHVKLNFVPFKHIIFNDSVGEEQELNDLIQSGNLNDSHIRDVLLSHHSNGKFSKTHGHITNKLAKMYMMMVERYAQKANWRGYSYLDEMKGKAIIELTAKGMFFNEAKSNNPFAYFTQVITNGFRIVFNDEKNNQNIRDELMMSGGLNPSMSKQLEHELHITKIRNEAHGNQ